MFEAIDTGLRDFIDQAIDSQEDGIELPCQVNDPEMWFAERPDDIEFAKALCGTCPLQRECLAGAVERREPWGVWGGELFQAGVVIARKRPRGRPRKNAIAA
ncbi:WhiB family transcriptional regulator [Yimella sp. RIT 621]|uniref:WhiB family transcriptional regulator n=1 Tax=Yimella sp. RIT 621 TaxID=2510323 RepID=UPI00101DEE65|nr:WhiB family transcriptional regulator [Yimella sp. RIT 621]RYG76073.1 WhiB family transcriptional regulator [Yimella sp. RIT 621]